MRAFLILLAFGACLEAQNPGLTVYLDNSGGQQPLSQLQAFPSTYNFVNTPVGSSSVVGARLVNTSAAAIQVASIGFVSGTQQNNNFTSDLPFGLSLSPGQGQFFHIYYVPFATGATSTSAQIGVGGPSPITFSTLQGTGTAAQVALSCTNSSVLRCDGNVLQPNELQAINFGAVPTTSSLTVTFTLSNGGSSSINPQQLVVLKTATNNPSSGFQLGALPANVDAGSSTTFTITFAPGTTATQQATLLVGSNSFTLQGVGTASIVGDISSLVITYTDSTGVNLTAQAATPINFGMTISGSGVNSTLLFTVSNPATTIDAVSVPSITVSGAGFAISGTNPAPVTIQPGASTTFSVVFSGSTTGTYTGTLLIGTRSFTLSAQSITSLVPAPSISVDQQQLVSQQQAHVSVQLAGAAPVGEIGTLTMQFTPSVANITDDPAIKFVATSGRQLQVTVANGAQVATYNGQSAITFQTGTTAGTIQFTVQFPNQAAVTQSYTIAGSAVQITSGQALRQAPNLVVTLTGFDNTYSAGQLSFTFYGTNGQILTPNGISVNATSAFQQYFFGSTQAGGAFSLQASFPVNGDVTQVGSVSVTLTNSIGQTSTTQTFQ